MKIESCTATAYKMNILWFVAIFGTIRSSSGDFFSDLEKLDIDTQLREIDDMLDKLDDDGTDDALNFDYWSDFFSDKCVYRCRNGGRPVPRRGHVPTSNGCGSFGLQLDTSSLPQMTKCCDRHDHCYDTCNQDRDKCDEDFRKCLDAMCDKLKHEISRSVYDGCKETSKLMYGGTTALGCSPYLDAQEKACDCATGESKSSTASKTGKNKQRQKKETDKTEYKKTEKDRREKSSKSNSANAKTRKKVSDEL